MKAFIDKYFGISTSGSNFRTEIIAGVTTFMTMAYILAVNPQILGSTGMDKGGVFVATVAAAVIGTLVMALLAKYPFALAPGMGLNAFFAYSVVVGLGYSWQMALTAVFVEGIIFMILSAFKVREAIFNAIPQDIKYAVTAGIGLFITFIGLKGAGLIASHSVTFVTLGDMGLAPAMLAFIGIMLTSILLIKNVKGALLLGIVLTYALGIIAQLSGWYDVNPEIGNFSLIPKLENLFKIPDISTVAFKLEFHNIFTIDFLVVVFAFLFVDLFDTIGTVIGVATKGNYLDKDGKFPRINKVLFADAIATTFGALLGTSTTTTYVESSTGVVAGGRTGFTSVVVAVLFIVALFFAPIFLAVPSFAVAPVLVIVGLMMMESVVKINFTNFEEAVPAFLTIVMMSFAYSIAEGIIFGVISWVVIKLLIGKTSQISIVMLILAILFTAKMLFSSAGISS
ncbi:MAG: NCS2 family permease [Bacteroidales bacterium]